MEVRVLWLYDVFYSGLVSFLFSWLLLWLPGQSAVAYVMVCNVIYEVGCIYWRAVWRVRES